MVFGYKPISPSVDLMLYFSICKGPVSQSFNNVLLLCSFQICLLCRERGHSLKNCPEKSDGDLKKFCYNCGGSGHSLSKCPKPIENGTLHPHFLLIELLVLVLNTCQHYYPYTCGFFMCLTLFYIFCRWYKLCELLCLQTAGTFEQGLS